jgi:hypothetical protein
MLMGQCRSPEWPKTARADIRHEHDASTDPGPESFVTTFGLPASNIMGTLQERGLPPAMGGNECMWLRMHALARSGERP